MRKIRLRRKNNVKFLNENKGITLVALIVTIIVMLVLAGVSMNAIIGDNGIVNQAISAKELTEESALLETINTIIVQAYAKIGESIETQDEIRDYISSCFENESISDYATIQNDETGYVIVYGIYSKNIMYLDSELNNYWTLEAVIGSSDDWYYKVDETTQKALLVGFNYDNLGSSLTIPNVIDGYLVSGLGDQVFMGRTKITSITFSEGLRTIGAKAFSGCTGLTTISDWPDTLTSIGDEAFYGCTNLSMALTFTDNIASVGASAFYNCSGITGTVSNLLKSGVAYGLNAFSGCSGITGDVTEAMNVLIGDSGTEIPDNLFSGMSGLTGTVTIGSNIVRIGEYAFYNCSGITGIDISEASSLKIIDYYAFSGCTSMGTNTNYSELDFSSYCTNLMTIGTYSFYNTSITKLTIPNNVTSIEKSSFRNSSKLTTIVLDSSGEYGEALFYACKVLTSVTFGDNFRVMTMPGSMFFNCTSLTTVTLPSSITLIGDYCFSGCTDLSTVNYSSSLTSIGESAFSNCTLLTTLPLNNNSELISSLATIDANAFYNCSVLGKTGDDGPTDIVSLLESSNVTTLGNNAFYGCAYLSGTISDSIIYNVNTVKISQGGSCFYGTQVKSARTFTLASSTEVASNEFQGTTLFVDEDNEEITEIEIPEGVTTIGDYAFDNCSSITKVIIPYTVTSIGKYAFNNCTELIEVVGKNESKEEIEEISGVIILGISCFENCTKLEDTGKFLNISTIPSCCWQDCSSLEEIVFFDKLTTIEYYAFRNTGLVNVELPVSVVSIGFGAFWECASLTTFDCQDCTSLTGLPYRCLSSCSSLKNVFLSDSISSLGIQCFASDSNLGAIKLPASCSEVSQSCFKNCKSLYQVSGCSNVTSIALEGFYGCSSLELTGLVDLKWIQLTSISALAFYECSSLTGEVLLSSDCYVESTAFSYCPLVYYLGY